MVGEKTIAVVDGLLRRIAAAAAVVVLMRSRRWWLLSVVEATWPGVFLHACLRGAWNLGDDVDIPAWVCAL